MANENNVRLSLERFLKNDYWREYYETAPTEKSKRYIALKFYWSTFIDADDYQDEVRELKETMSIEDWKHLYKYSGDNPFRPYCLSMIRKLEAGGNDDENK